MSDIIYVKIQGERQGNISVGCGAINSIGNRYQLGHENEIFAFGLSNEMSGTGVGFSLHELNFSKLIDKSSPMLGQGISNNERYFFEFNIYRISKYGKWEKYYYIELRGATLASITANYANNNLDTEVVAVRYEYIVCRHLIANTEFSYFTLPVNYNSLFSTQNPIVAAQVPQFETLNSKSVGHLLAAGGVYNGNIEGFQQTAEQLGGEAKTGYDQVLNETTKGVAIAAASIAAGFGIGRLSVAREVAQLDVNSNLHVLGKVKGEYSAIKPGPLSPDIAETFAGGIYKEIVLSEDTTFFRSGVKDIPFGQYLGYEQPLGVIQSRIDKAVLPVWPSGAISPLDTKFAIRIPAGNTVFVGETGYQYGFYQGGTDQVVSIKPWDISGVQVSNIGVLK